ncbi:SNF2-related protein [Brevibacillus sp. 179-C9.3 HS]|uniref:SNF2-related protein n=1 Tax=unclassified Brevibacillus TaxID=2684853 RepID=UPI00399FFC39
MATRVKLNSKGLTFSTGSLLEAIGQNECFACENVQEKDLSLHKLITSTTDVAEIRPVKSLRLWGIDVEKNDIEKVQQHLSAMRKKYSWQMKKIQETKQTPQYLHALRMVQEKFGNVFNDGSSLFPYQIETAALMIVLKRTLTALDTGLGKTRTTLVGMAADDANKKSLVITMSRNINDWIRECETIGLGNEHIVVENKTDLHSDKRIHIVSYEKWATDRIVFRRKPHTCCPSCQVSIRSLWIQSLGYCKLCKTKNSPLQEERWSEDNLPSECPCCKKDWEGHYSCTCGYTVIEKRKPALYKYMHNGYNACAIDEAHYIKNGFSKRAMAVRAAQTDRRYALSGTPAENGSEDLYWILGWVTGFSSRFENPLIQQPYAAWGRAGEVAFREHFGGGKKRAVFDIDSVAPRVSNHVELWNMLDTLMIRKRKQDEGVAEWIEVPKPKNHRMHLALHEAERELYDQILADFKNWYEMELARKEAAAAKNEVYRISTISICAWMDKLRKAASCPWSFDRYDAIKSNGTTAKLEYMKNKAKDLLRRGKKLLVFSSHKETVEQLALLLDGVIPGKKAAYIHGDVKMQYRWDLMKKFQDPNDPMSILVMSTKTGAESYTLTEAKAVFLFDLDFNAKKIEQCYSRAVRIGQRDIVDIHWLLGVDTIDVNMHGLVLSKASGVDLAIDREELDFAKIAQEFEGDRVAGASTAIDYEKFAAEMLSRGTKRVAS